MSKKTIAPIDVRTDKQLCSLLRSGKRLGVYSLEIDDECTVTITREGVGRINIPKAEFNKLARWYMGQQACRD